jgi:hypothetical protein
MNRPRPVDFQGARLPPLGCLAAWSNRFTGGTGLFNGATGSGTATFTQQPGSTSALGVSVSGSETFTSLSAQI